MVVPLPLFVFAVRSVGYVLVYEAGVRTAALALGITRSIRAGELVPLPTTGEIESLPLRLLRDPRRLIGEVGSVKEAVIVATAEVLLFAGIIATATVAIKHPASVLAAIKKIGPIGKFASRRVLVTTLKVGAKVGGKLLPFL